MVVTMATRWVCSSSHVDCKRMLVDAFCAGWDNCSDTPVGAFVFFLDGFSGIILITVFVQHWSNDRRQLR